MKRVYYIPLLLLLALIQSGCGGGTDAGAVQVSNNINGTSNDEVVISVSDLSSNPSTTNLVSNARYSLKVTDAPLDGVAKVVISFASVELRSDALNTALLITFNTPKKMDLLSLQGLTTAELLNELEIPAGVYSEIRLRVIDDFPSTYVELDGGGIRELKVPSGSSSGLKIKGTWSIAEGQSSAYTIDFDLRKSIKKAGASGKYIMNPVLRLVEDSTIGHIRGTLSVTYLTAQGCNLSDPDSYRAVYVFEGAFVVPDDIDLSDNGDIDPVTTATIVFDTNSGDYLYEAAFLPPGDYTVAYTCNANLEDPEDNEDLLFFGQQNATVQENNILLL